VREVDEEVAMRSIVKVVRRIPAPKARDSRREPGALTTNEIRMGIADVLILEVVGAEAIRLLAGAPAIAARPARINVPVPLQGDTMKKGYIDQIETATTKNTDYRRVIYTGKYSQLVLMSLKPGEEIGAEVHDTIDQFFRFEEGEGVVEIDGARHPVKDGSGVVVPNGTRHNVINTSKTADLKLYTIYSPPNHQDGIVRKTKKEADEQEEHFDGKTTE
jgi:mannose-6-phosphate isomerase-like protein (cupin superfamily)